MRFLPGLRRRTAQNIGASVQANNPIADEHPGRRLHASLRRCRIWKLPSDIPLGKAWIARVLKSKGLSNAKIARKLHQTEATVRRHLNEVRESRQPQTAQTLLTPRYAIT